MTNIKCPIRDHWKPQDNGHFLVMHKCKCEFCYKSGLYFCSKYGVWFERTGSAASAEAWHELDEDCYIIDTLPEYPE